MFDQVSVDQVIQRPFRPGGGAAQARGDRLDPYNALGSAAQHAEHTGGQRIIGRDRGVGRGDRPAHGEVVVAEPVKAVAGP